MEGGGKKTSDKGDQPSAPQKRRDVDAHLVHHIDKGLSVVPTEVTDRVYLLLVREDCLNQGDNFVRKEGTTDQAFAGRLVRAYRDVSSL